jgi:hypothetical protein
MKCALEKVQEDPRLCNTNNKTRLQFAHDVPNSFKFDDWFGDNIASAE